MSDTFRQLGLEAWGGRFLTRIKESNMKVLLILVDGMRPDAIAHIPQVQSFKEKATYTMEAQTVLPSVTLPCHVSLFHSVTPQRHGTTTNVYMPQVRPIQGLFEVLSQQKKTCAMSKPLVLF